MFWGFFCLKIKIRYIWISFFLFYKCNDIIDVLGSSATWNKNLQNNFLQIKCKSNIKATSSASLDLQAPVWMSDTHLKSLRHSIHEGPAYFTPTPQPPPITSLPLPTLLRPGKNRKCLWPVLTASDSLSHSLIQTLPLSLSTTATSPKEWLTNFPPSLWVFTHLYTPVPQKRVQCEEEELRHFLLLWEMCMCVQEREREC